LAAGESQAKTISQSRSRCCVGCHCCHQKIVEKIENIRVRVSIKMGKFSTVNGRPIELRINSLKAIRTSKIPLAISSFHFTLPSFHC